MPSSDRAGVSLAFDYSQFLLNERQVSPYTQGMYTLPGWFRSPLCGKELFRDKPGLL